jgi:hypothetical protein
MNPLETLIIAADQKTGGFLGFIALCILPINSEFVESIRSKPIHIVLLLWLSRVVMYIAAMLFLFPIVSTWITSPIMALVFCVSVLSGGSVALFKLTGLRLNEVIDQLKLTKGDK